MKHARSLFAVAATVAWPALAQTVPPDTPLIVDGPLVVDARDFEANIIRIPEDKRAAFRMSPDRVAGVVDNVFITRALAARARAEGLDKDPLIQRRARQLEEGLLADAYIQKVEKQAATVKLDQRARELYKAEPARYTTQERVTVDHVLVDLNGRTKEFALERARKIAEDARRGADFSVLVSQYSDDPAKDNNQGRLADSPPSMFVPPVREAIAGLKKPGEIAGPVESPKGYHILRLVERKAPQLQPFERVRQQIIDAETARLKKLATEDVVREIRQSSTVVTHRDNVEKLVLPLDPEVMRRATEQVSK